MLNQNRSNTKYKIYSQKNIPIQHDKTLEKPDSPIKACQKISNLLTLVRKQYEEKQTQKIKETKLQSLQKLYKEEIQRLQTKVKQLSHNRQIIKQKPPFNEELIKIMLLSSQVDRLRKYIDQSEQFVNEKKSEILQLKLKHSEDLNNVKILLTNHSKKQLAKIKSSFEQIVEELQLLHRQELLETQKRYSTQKIAEEAAKQQIQLMDQEHRKMIDLNKRYIQKIREQEIQLKHLQKRLSQSIDLIENTKIKMSEKEGQQKLQKLARQQLLKQKREKSSRSVQTQQIFKTEVANLQNQILKLESKNHFLEDELKVFRELQKFSPRSDKKDEYKRGDESLEISLQNSNLNEKEKLKIEQLISQMKDQILNRDHQLNQKQEELKSLKKQIEDRQNEIEFKDRKIRELIQDSPQSYNVDFQQLNDKISEKDHKIQLLEFNLNKRDLILIQKNQEIEELENTLRQNSEMLAKKEEDYTTLKQMFEHQLLKNKNNNDNDDDNA